MRPILTVTLNPALDLATSAARVTPGPKLRCEPPRVDPGGGGINVSRVIDRLGGHSRAFVALGGATGARMAEAIARENIDAELFDAPGETRQSLSVADRETGDQYRFVLPGPVWTKTESLRSLAAITRATSQQGYTVLSGSLPPGVPPDMPTEIVKQIGGISARLILDTSGETLAHAARPVLPAHVLRMDAHEAETLAGSSLKTRGDTADFAECLVRQGAAEIVIIARGADGSVLATAADRLFSEAAKVPVKSKVGAGDSFLAGFTLALSRDKTLSDALSEGMAAASAAVMTEATELCRAEDAIRLIASCPVSTV